MGDHNMLKELPGLNIYHFQGSAMFILRFSFEGHRNLCASRLATGFDLETELEKSAAMLASCYANKRVRAVELVAYERGAFDYFTWPEGLELLSSYYEQTVLSPEAQSGDTGEEPASSNKEDE